MLLCKMIKGDTFSVDERKSSSLIIPAMLRNVFSLHACSSICYVARFIFIDETYHFVRLVHCMNSIVVQGFTGWP